MPTASRITAGLDFVATFVEGAFSPACIRRMARIFKRAEYTSPASADSRPAAPGALKNPRGRSRGSPSAACSSCPSGRRPRSRRGNRRRELSSTESVFFARARIFSLSVLEEATEVILQHGPFDRQLHVEGERAVAVLVVDDDRADGALAEMHVGVLGILARLGDAKPVVAKRLAQEFLQLCASRSCPRVVSVSLAYARQTRHGPVGWHSLSH